MSRGPLPPYSLPKKSEDVVAVKTEKIEDILRRVRYSPSEDPQTMLVPDNRLETAELVAESLHDHAMDCLRWHARHTVAARVHESDVVTTEG